MKIYYLQPTTNIHNYTIYDDDVCNGTIFMKRWRSTSFLGIDVKVWKYRKFRLFNFLPRNMERK